MTKTIYYKENNNLKNLLFENFFKFEIFLYFLLNNVENQCISKLIQKIRRL